MGPRRSSLKRLTTVSLLTALSAVGAFLKLPGPVGSIALDSWPGYLAVLVLGPVGAVVASTGHLASAFTAGFPLTLPLHFAIAAEMGLCALAFGWVKARLGTVAGAAAGTLLNAVVAPVLLLPWLGKGLVASLILPLFVAASVNVAVALAVYRAVPIGRSTHEA
jgi:riboflavin transporter FmnP